MSLIFSRCVLRVSSRQSSVSGESHHALQNPCLIPMMAVRTSAPLSAEPKKKKKVDPRRDQVLKDRLKKRLKKLEKVPPELIPIEDFIIPATCYDKMRYRPPPTLSFEETERRSMLLKEWSRYKQKQHLAETASIKIAMEAQAKALAELKLESEELYRAALKPDLNLLPFTREGPVYTPPITDYHAPDGKFNDITKVYTQ